MACDTIDFWFTGSSTYTYLTVTRLASVERLHGVTFRWRPFRLLTILAEMKHVPFSDKPAKSAHMWRDIERRAAMYGIPARVPVIYPVKRSDLVNQIATLGMEEGWGPQFVRAAYRRWFVSGEETGGDRNVHETLREIGHDPDRVISAATSSRIVSKLAAETNIARGLGIFGSPSFVVDQELFWGDDRLEDAISWAKFGRVQRLST